MLDRILQRISTWCTTRPWHVLGLFSALTLAAVPLVASLPLEADLRETLPSDMAQVMERRLRLFGAYDLAFLLVQTETRGKADLLAFGAELERQLSASPLIRRVEFGHPPSLLQALQDVALDYAPLFVDAEHIDDFDQLMTSQGIRTQIQKTLTMLSTPGSGMLEGALLDDPLQLRRFAFARLGALRGSFRFDPTSPYFLSPDGKALLVKIAGQASADDTAGVKATVRLLTETCQRLLSLPAFRGLTVDSTGSYFLAAESERIIRRDLVQSVNLAVVLICGLMAWAMRRWGVFLYGQLPNLLGLFLALAVFTLFRPRLNALTLGCAAALIGLGDDFTIHILTQCFAGLGQGKARQEAVATAIRETGGSLFGAAATTMVAFTAFLFASQNFLRDMGMLSALGIACCFLLSLTFLPALVVCLPQRSRPYQPHAMGVPAITAGVLRQPRLVLGLSLGLCLAALTALLMWPPGFETDLRNIHAAHSPVLLVQATIAERFGGSQEPLTLMLEGATEEQVVHAMRQLSPALHTLVADGLLAAVTSLDALYPAADTQAAVLRLLHNKDPGTLLEVVTASLEEAGFDVAALQPYLTRVRHSLTQRQPLDLEDFRRLGFGDLVGSFLSHDQVGAAGLMVLFPRRDLWTLADRQVLSQRLSSLLAERGLSGAMAGLYTVSAESAARTQADFRQITLWAMGLVGLVIVLQFRRPWAIGMVFLPLACGTLWTAGIFAYCGWKLNFMNIAILPMLLGIGIDNGIHMVHRFRLRGAYNVQDALHFTSAAVFLSTLTTLLGFGSLALSVNQGIASVGLVSLTGMTACLVASLLTLPAALALWGKRVA